MMEDKKEHPLLTRFPDDADWEEFDNLSLLRQCLIRDIPSEEISRDNKIRLLQNFSKKHVTEIRKIPGRRSPSRFTREKKSLRLNKATYQIAQAKHTSDAKRTVFWTEFTLSDEKGSTCVVAFKEVPSCTCPSQPTLYHCDHIMYLLLVVLNCPEPLCWQAAFLPSELIVIYQHSHALRTLNIRQKSIRATQAPRDTLCVYCFKSLDTESIGQCSLCHRIFHWNCHEAVSKVKRMNPRGRGCRICWDIHEWNIGKYLDENQVPAATTAETAVAATTTTTTINPVVPTPKANIVQQCIERKEKNDHGVSSSSLFNKQADRDTRVTHNSGVNRCPSHPSQSSSLLSSSSSNISTLSQSNINEQELLIPSHSQQASTSKDIPPQLKSPTPVPAVFLQRSTSAPPTSNSEPMHLELKQHKAQERAENSPPSVSQNCSQALAKSLSSVPSVHYPNSNASAPRAPTPEQAGPTPVLPADGVDAHNSAATTAAVTAQTTPPVSSDDIPGDSCSSQVINTDADVLKRQAARLVRKCRRLERKSARIKKHVKREMDKIDREYQLELMMLKEKRKIKYMRSEQKWEHDLKRLKHQREKLEEKLKDLD